MCVGAHLCFELNIPPIQEWNTGVDLFFTVGSNCETVKTEIDKCPGIDLDSTSVDGEGYETDSIMSPKLSFEGFFLRTKTGRFIKVPNSCRKICRGWSFWSGSDGHLPHFTSESQLVI